MRVKKWIGCLTAACLCVSTLFLGACGGGQKPNEDFHIEGSCEEILGRVYEAANVSDDMRSRMEEYVTSTMAAEEAVYILGTEAVSFSDAVYSVPLINVDPYQCVVLRVNGDDIDNAKREIADNADPKKWVCVEAESVIVESNGDVILFVMADTETAEALRDAFLALT